MRYLLSCAFVGVAIAGACGGRTSDPDPTTGIGGAGGAIGTGGGTTVGGTGGGTTVGGTGGGTTVGGTGGSGTTGGSGGTGGAGGTDPAPEFAACSGPGQCTLAPRTCCTCGVLGLGQLAAINSTRRDAYNKQVCGPDPLPCPPCVGIIDPYLTARCESGRCRGVDIRNDPTYTKCGTDQECVLRKGLACCQCGAEGDWVAVSRVGEMLLSNEQCGPGTACPSCIPVPPAGTSAVCRNGACTKVP